jgi:hypothetical protein
MNPPNLLVRETDADRVYEELLIPGFLMSKCYVEKFASRQTLNRFTGFSVVVALYAENTDRVVMHLAPTFPSVPSIHRRFHGAQVHSRWPAKLGARPFAWA